MKALNYKAIIFLLVIAISGSSLFAKEVKKTLHKEFQTNKLSELTIEVKFSTLHVESWGQNQVRFDVEITVENDDESKATKMLDMIDVVMVQNGNHISLETELSEKFSKTSWGKSKRFNIEITAKVPADIHFNLESTFGSATITELTGEVNIESSFGSIVADRLLGDEINIELNNGSITVQELTDAFIEANYGSVRIEKANNLDLEINMGDCFIGEVINLSAESNTGELTVANVNASFKSIKVESNMGSTTIKIDKNIGFNLTASMTMGSMNIPELDNQKETGNSMNRKITGTHGNGNASIVLEGNMGSMKLILK